MSKSSDLEYLHKVPEKFKRHSMTFPGLLETGLTMLETKYYLRTFPHQQMKYIIFLKIQK